MTTPFWLTGFEYGVNPNANGGGLATAASGTPTLVTSPVHTGTYALRLIGDNTTAQYVRKNHTASLQIAVARTYIRIPTGGLPTTAGVLLHWRTTGAVLCGLQILPSTGEVKGFVSGTTAGSKTLNLDQWYYVDMRINITTSTWTLDWSVDGVAQTQVTLGSQSTTDSLSAYYMGTLVAANTYTIYFDDTVLSETSADFPIGAGGTEVLVPTSDGTNNAGTNIIEDNAGTDIGVTPAYDKINSIPISSTTYVRQAATGTGNYAEVNFGDITATHSGIIGAQGLLAYTSATTTANRGATIISKDSFSTNTEIWGNPTTTQDYSDGSTSNLFYRSAILVDVNDDTTVNALKARIGYSGDANPNPYWIDLVVEVAYNISSSHTGTLSKTLAALTSSSSGTVSVGGTLSKTLETLTSSSDGDVGVIASFSKTLSSLTLSSAGTVINPEATGILNKTFDPLTLESDGQVIITGSLNKTLDTLTLDSDGVVVVGGSLSKTLTSVTLLSDGDVSVTGSLSKTLSDLTLNSDGTVGTVTVTGTLNKTLADLLPSSETDVLVNGTLSKTLSSLTSDSDGTVIVSGSLNKTLQNLTLSSSSVVSITGTLNKTLDSLTSDSDGAVSITGSLSKTLGELTLDSEGGSFNTGNLNKTLTDASLSSSASVVITGSLSKTLSSLSLDSDGDVSVTGTLSNTLTDATLESTGVVGTVVITGTVNKTLGNITSSSTAVVLITGNANKTLENLVSNSNAQVLITGQTNEILADLSSQSNGNVLISGSLSETLDDATLVSTGWAGFGVFGSLNQTLEALTLSANGTVFIAPQFNVIAFISDEVNSETVLRKEKTSDMMVVKKQAKIIPIG